MKCFIPLTVHVIIIIIKIKNRYKNAVQIKNAIY